MSHFYKPNILAVDCVYAESNRVWGLWLYGSKDFRKPWMTEHVLAKPWILVWKHDVNNVCDFSIHSHGKIKINGLII